MAKILLYDEKPIETKDAVIIAVLDSGVTAVCAEELVADVLAKEKPFLKKLDDLVKDGAEKMRAVTDEIKKKSVEVQAINAEVRAKIREKYSIEDEIYLLRTGPSAESRAWNDHVEHCRNLGREKKAELGL